MTISNANPVQFWLPDEDTYNETEVCSIQPVFWCQPFKADDEITTQVEDAPVSRALIKNPTFDGDIDWWDGAYAIAGSNAAQTWGYDAGSGGALVSVAANNINTRGLKQSITRTTNDQYSWHLTGSITCSSYPVNVTLVIHCFRVDGFQLQVVTANVMSANGSFNVSGSFAQPDLSFIVIRFVQATPSVIATASLIVTEASFTGLIYRSLSMAILSDDTFLTSDAFANLGNGIFQESFVPSELGITCQEITLLIVDGLLAGTVLDAVDFTDMGGGLLAWVKSTHTLSKAASGVFQSLGAIQPISIPAGTVITPFTVHAEIVGSFNPGIFYVDFILRDSFGSQIAVVANTGLTPGSYDWVIDLGTISADAVTLEVLGGIPTTPTSGSITITIPDAILYLPALAILAKSGCIDINEFQSCTELIQYSNSGPFDDINFNPASPSLDFFLRVPAIFFEEEFPDEYESIDLSNSEIVQLSSEVKHKKLLDVGWMPFYMIEKLQLVLSNDSLIIQGKNWIKGDGMTKIQGNKRYPLRKTQFLLTDKDFIKRNVL